MNQNPSASEWAAARGEQWAANLAGMEAMLHPVDEPLIAALRLETPSRIAEVGCGGGGTTLSLAKRAPSGSVVHGFDVSPRLIELARRRVPSDTRAIGFDVADMATAEPNEPYQRLVSRFGVMFFDEPEAAFANLLRWLEPAGRFAFAVWGQEAQNECLTTVREVVSRLVEVPKPKADAPGPFRYADSQRLLELLAQAGFGELSVAEWRGALPIGGLLAPVDAARFVLSSFSAYSELLERAGATALADAQQALTSVFASYYSAGAVRLGASVHLVTGTRP